MAENAKHDKNNTPTLLAVSSADGSTPVRLWADPDSHRLIVDSVAGTIIGPGSSTDNAIVRWNGTDGTTIQDSAITIDDTTGSLNVLDGWDTTSTGSIDIVAGGSNKNI